MDKVIETKSQMIMRIADLSEALNRLQAENEKLKTDIGIYKGIIDTDKEANERLKEENYQLQKDCQICENFIDCIPCKPLRDMDYDLQKVINQRDNYIQALQEIRDMATLFHSVNENKGLDRFKNNILTKINEVIGAE